MAEALFPGHSLGGEILGTTQTVGEITPTAVRDFHRQWYRRANIVVSVVGPIDHHEIVARIDTALRSLDTGVRPLRHSPVSGVVSEVFTARSIEQNHLAMGWRAPSQLSEDRHALAVATQVLGGGWSSRLFREVREKRGLSYSVFASVGAFADTGTLSVYAATAPDRLAELRTVIEEQIADLVENAPGERELEVARGGFEGATVLGLEDTSSRMARLATSVLIRDRVVGIDEYLAAVRNVSASDAQRVLAGVISGSRAVSIVGPTRA